MCIQHAVLHWLAMACGMLYYPGCLSGTEPDGPWQLVLYVSDSIPRQCLEFEVSMLHCLTQIRMRSRLIALALTMTTTQCELLKAGDNGMTRDPRACRR